MTHEDEARLAAGYDSVYAAIPRSETFARIWRAHSLGDDYPRGFEHISFLTLPEMRGMAASLELSTGSVLADLACGMGGPGLWIARETGARLTGVDISDIALDHARVRAEAVGLSDVAQFSHGSFAKSGLATASVDGVMTVDALQYAPDKHAALHEFARILRPGGRLAFACFEVEPRRVAGLPIFGTDPVADYAPLLEGAGFAVTSYVETPGWLDWVTATYEALVEAKPALTVEMGDGPCVALLGEVTLTLQLKPYRRRVMVAARKR